MKKLFIVLGICLGIAGYAKAEISIGDLVNKIPSLNAGVFYNLNDSKFAFTSTFKALSYKGVNLNLGYATPDMAVASLAYEVVRLEKLGIELPILKDIVIDAGWALGWKKILNTNEFVNGPSVTLKIKW